MSSLILKYPYPYKAWLTMANDPDNTELKDWRELHGFIWEELGLPFGDSLFVRSFNQNLLEQVNLENNPEIALAHLHDIIHTWGDYMHGRKRGFDREDAAEAISLLEKHGIKPRVWIDHASFVGNMLHGTQKGATPRVNDSSGFVYENFLYTLDLAQKVGIRYVWNGEVTATIGQDRELNFNDYDRLHGGNALKAVVKSTLHRVPSDSGLFAQPDNRQYYKHRFPDGAKLYCFRRYGTWQDADINGLYNIIKPELIDQLIKCNGTSIVYSHLGKRQADSMGNAKHIPQKSRTALTYLSEKFKSRELMISSVSEMLDYLVIRDNIVVNTKENRIQLNSDGIRYQPLTKEGLLGKTFSFRKGAFDTEDLQVTVDGKSIVCQVKIESKEFFSIHFA
ncbi:MAG: hypothetical protein QF371_00790 [Flavobacteriales bacterium]|nr:hypothetical protein [Flavobacteriales bacterium]